MFNVVLFVGFVMVMREVRKKCDIKVLIIVYCRLEIENYVN